MLNAWCMHALYIPFRKVTSPKVPECSWCSIPEPPFNSGATKDTQAINPIINLFFYPLFGSMVFKYLHCESFFVSSLNIVKCWTNSAGPPQWSRPCGLPQVPHGWFQAHEITRLKGLFWALRWLEFVVSNVSTPRHRHRPRFFMFFHSAVQMVQMVQRLPSQDLQRLPSASAASAASWPAASWPAFEAWSGNKL